MDIQIVQMTFDDIPQVAALEKACFPDPWPQSILVRELENELSLWLVAKESGRVLGYIGSQSVLDESDMMNLAVSPDARRQGIGRMLVRSLCEALAAKGIRSLMLEVRESNAPAVSLYESMGFQQVGLRPNYYFHPKENARIFRKEGLA